MDLSDVVWPAVVGPVAAAVFVAGRKMLDLRDRLRALEGGSIINTNGVVRRCQAPDRVVMGGRCYSCGAEYHIDGAESFVVYKSASGGKDRHADAVTRLADGDALVWVITWACPFCQAEERIELDERAEEWMTDYDD